VSLFLCRSVNIIFLLKMQRHSSSPSPLSTATSEWYASDSRVHG
jgi:hypothetical protein